MIEFRLSWGTEGYYEVQGVIKGYKVLLGAQRVMLGYRGQLGVQAYYGVQRGFYRICYVVQRVAGIRGHCGG